MSKSLKVNKGIEQPENIDKNSVARFKQIKRRDLSAEQYFKAILSGDKTTLGRAVTLVESLRKEDMEKAKKLISLCLPHSGNSVRIGITGVPGVGKSSFIDVFGSLLTEKGHKVAVLTIDPSSDRSGGSILGDKTRMERLSADDNAFIRPSPSGGTLGGVARKTRETVVLCEAAGYDIIIIETVGVGQSETIVHSMVDFFLLLMLAGAGDDLQGIKRGIMEMADAIVITKADSGNERKSELAAVQYRNALHLFPPTESGWTPKVTTCSAMFNKGIENVWTIISDYVNLTKKNLYFYEKRRKQSKNILYETIDEAIKTNFYENQTIKKELKKYEDLIIENKINPIDAAQKLLDIYFDNLHK